MVGEQASAVDRHATAVAAHNTERPQSTRRWAARSGWGATSFCFCLQAMVWCGSIPHARSIVWLVLNISERE